MSGDTMQIDSYTKPDKDFVDCVYGFCATFDDFDIDRIKSLVKNVDAPRKAEVAFCFDDARYELTFDELRRALEPFRKERP